ncbi:MAG: T9SS type A sorting domain-containing protein, partial [Bacteroidetes bacterium]|nr:T9SS type A sorting domain-containing protein [Bacteroidota bacterium]
MAGSNGLLINEINLPNNKKRFEWKHNHAIDFYLISFSVADYQEYNFNVTLPNSQSVLVQNYVYDHPNLLNQFQSDIDETGAMLIEFSNKYGIYPFANEKYGHCMAPFSGGMEHQTMTTQGFFNRSLTAHELGHQWFGDHVTCATWGHIWINEGFASYSEYIFQESVNYNIAQNDMAGVHNNVMSQPGGSIYVYDDNNENAIFNSRLVYDKGSALVHMIRHWVNDDNLFFTALQTYQNIFEDSTATAEDFFSVIENIAEIDLQNELQQWYYGEGYPTFSLKYNNSPNGLIIELSQAGSMSNITPFFETAIEIKLNFNNGTDTILRVNNEWNNQQYLFNQMPTISSIEIDPLNWVLNKVGNVEEDLNLVYTSINSINKSNNITLYPNPNKGSFIVETEEQTPYKIYDLLGKEIKSGVLKEGKNQIDLLSVKGLYFFKAGKLFPVVIN